MEITRTSPITGRNHTFDLPVTIAQLRNYACGGILLQDAFPQLSPSEREFIKTGITPLEWNLLVGNEE